MVIIEASAQKILREIAFLVTFIVEKKFQESFYFSYTAPDSKAKMNPPEKIHQMPEKKAIQQISSQFIVLA